MTIASSASGFGRRRASQTSPVSWSINTTRWPHGDTIRSTLVSTGDAPEEKTKRAPYGQA